MFDIIRTCELTQPPETHTLHGQFFTTDNAGQKLGFEVVKNGAAQSLNGYSVSANAIRADFATVAISGGVISGNVASVSIPDAALAVNGPCVVNIRLTNGNTKITLGEFAFTVKLNTTDTIVDPGHVIPSIEELLAQIAVMEDAVSRGNAAAELCEGMTVSATAVSGTTPNVTKTTQYVSVTPASGANPKELGYYEENSGVYTLTEDTSVQDGKTYYTGSFNLQFGLVPAAITSQVTEYQVADSGSTIPTGTWLDGLPSSIPQGKFLWMRHTITWGNSQTSVLYSVSRQGIDGSGAVSTVNNVSPDANGNVDLGALVKSVNDNIPDSSGAVTVPVDATPTASSTNPVQSGGVKTALDAKADSTDLTATNNALAQTNGAIAIVQTGDTATQTIDADAFILWKGNLYTADASIPADTAFSTEGGNKNLTAAPNGGLNALNRPNPVLYYHFESPGSHTFTLANGARLLLTSSDSSATSQGMWFIRTTGAGAVGKKDVAAASDITFDMATANKLKITVAGYTWLKFENIIGGNITDIVSV